MTTIRTRTTSIGIAAAAGAAFLLLLGGAVYTQTIRSDAKGSHFTRQVTRLARPAAVPGHAGTDSKAASDAPAGGQFYVAVNGRASGSGSFDDPWDLATALAHPTTVKPGDTIWLRGGTYAGAFVSNLDGGIPCTNPIIVRSYTGELARLDGAGIPAAQLPGSILTIQKSCGVYRDFEVTSSTNPKPDGGQGSRPQGLQVVGPNNKIVNLIVHDTGQGIGFWEGAPDSEISGCLLYYNGNSQLDHGVYTQNVTGTKSLLDNIVFRNYGFGIHAYTTNSHVNNFHIEGNVSFDNGKLNASNDYKSNFLLGSGKGAASSCTSSPQVAQNPQFVENYSYHPRGSGGREIDLGYSTGSCNPTATGNYLVGDTTLTLGPAFGTISIAENTFYGSVAGFSSSGYANSVYLSSRPTGAAVFVRQNAYEAGRALIAVYNWDLAPSVDVDLHEILVSGRRFEVRDAQNYYGPPVVQGTYAGGPVTIPLAGLAPAKPVGQNTPDPTGPEFNAFVLLSGDVGRAVPVRPDTPVIRARPIPGRPTPVFR